MKKLILNLVGLVLILSLVGMASATETTEETTCNTGVGIGINVTPSNSCPEILDVSYTVETDVSSQICDDECGIDTTCLAPCVNIIENQRSYAFEGETITFEVKVKDTDGIVQDCVKAFVTLESNADQIEAGCVRIGTEENDTIGHFRCIYTVEPAVSGTQGEYWVSVMAEDQCGIDGCEDHASGTISLYLNPAVSLKISAQNPFGLMYDESGDVLNTVYAGNTIYSPYFTVENSAENKTGLYLLLQIYGKDMWDYDSSAALCPNSNVLDISNVQYKADHSNVHQDWTVMPEGYGGRRYVFRTGPHVFLGNFLGIGDDITMRLRLNIPSPCVGNFDDGGEIVFVGRVL